MKQNLINFKSTTKDTMEVSDKIFAAFSADGVSDLISFIVFLIWLSCSDIISGFLIK